MASQLLQLPSIATPIHTDSILTTESSSMTMDNLLVISYSAAAMDTLPCKAPAQLHRLVEHDMQ